MKKILEKTITFLIGSIMCIPLNYFTFLHSWKDAIMFALSISIAYFISVLIIEFVIPNIKNPFKRLAFLVRYKKFRSCNGCRFFINSKCKHLLFTYDKEFKYCRKKRSFNTLKWLKKLFATILWRLQFKKVKVEINDHFYNGRCINCDAGNPKVECSEYYCPCKENEQLKRVYTSKILKKLFFICIIALLFSSCSVYVNCNFNKVPKYKTTQQDSTVLQINEYWF